jgi:hypothetical protein
MVELGTNPKEDKQSMATFAQRMIGAAKLDVRTYEEVEADTTATAQAMAVVVLSSVAAGIGSVGQRGVLGLVVGTVAALIGWFVWAFLAYLIGTKLLPEPQTSSNVGELLRTTGFSSSPGLLRILGVLPMLGVVVSFLASIWMLIAMVIAVRQALDYTSTWRAVGVCIIGWLILVVLAMLVA